MRHMVMASLVGLASIVTVPARADTIILDYPGFTLWYDCALGGAVAARYEIGPDTGSLERDHAFFLDENLPEGCKGQTSTDTYASVPNAPDDYDLGHLVPANHLDDRKDAIAASNVMTNITPQQSSFNRTGAWRKTEKLIECWRDEADKGPLIIWIAVVWGTDASNDHFIQSHGIVTPDRFMKLVFRPVTGEVVAWNFPNAKIRSGDTAKYLATPAEVVDALGVPLHLGSIDVEAKTTTWPDPGCDQG